MTDEQWLQILPAAKALADAREALVRAKVQRASAYDVAEWDLKILRREMEHAEAQRELDKARMRVLGRVAETN